MFSRIAWVPILGTTLLLLACSGQAQPTATGGGAPPPQAGPATIMIRDNSYTPPSTTVKAGTAVTWEWANTNNPHSVLGKFAGADVDSGIHSGSDRFVFTFGSAGTFDYQCAVHGPSMSGKVSVE